MSSWSDPWTQAFSNISNIAMQYGNAKNDERLRQQQRTQELADEKRKDKAAKKLMEERLRLEQDMGVAFEGFSPEGQFTRITKGEAAKGATLPQWALDQQRAQAEAESDKASREAEMDNLEMEVKRTQAEENRARGAYHTARAASGGGLGRQAVDPTVTQALRTATSLLNQMKQPAEVYQTLSAAYGQEVADAAMGGMAQSRENAKGIARTVGQGLARVFGAGGDNIDEVINRNLEPR